jgi:hypothetical protein
VQILWWLVPPVAATVLAMLWVSWLGREGRGEIDPEIAARRLSRAMARPSRVTARSAPARPTARSERSSGIAVRTSSRPPSRPTMDEAHEARQASAHGPVGGADEATEQESTRRAS